MLFYKIYANVLDVNVCERQTFKGQMERNHWDPVIFLEKSGLGKEAKGMNSYKMCFIFMFFLDIRSTGILQYYLYHYFFFYVFFFNYYFLLCF